MLSVREITKAAHRLGFRPDRWDVEQIQQFYGMQITKVLSIVHSVKVLQLNFPGCKTHLKLSRVIRSVTDRLP
jgi:hypothetical protein